MTTIISGGAIGSDTLWVQAALLQQYKILIMTFKGHHTKHISNTSHIELTTEQLSEADDILHTCAKILKRNVPKDGYILKLLQQTYHIVKDADAVYALGYLNSDNGGIGVEGGTAWGLEIFYRLQNEFSGKPLKPIFLYDILGKQWYLIKDYYYPRLHPIDNVPHPSTFSCVAMIGSREIGPDIKDVIRKVYSESSS